MKIRTHLNIRHRAEFKSLKRKVTGEWQFLVSGEWSSLSGYSGKHRFLYRTTKDQTSWAILSEGFPYRIIAVAIDTKSAPAEKVLGSMLRAVSNGGGESIEFFDEVNPALDGDLLWEVYSAP